MGQFSEVIVVYQQLTKSMTRRVPDPTTPNFIAMRAGAWGNRHRQTNEPKRIMLGDIKNKFGETLDYTFHSASRESDKVVVLGHGVTGNKDRPFVVALAEELAKPASARCAFPSQATALPAAVSSGARFPRGR